MKILLRIVLFGVILMMAFTGTSCSNRYYVKTARAEMEEYSYTDIDEAKEKADKLAQYGYQVYDSSNKVVYTTHSELVADILSSGKRITDFAREAGFKYGHAPMNPAMNCEAKLVSCDRFGTVYCF